VSGHDPSPAHAGGRVTPDRGLPRQDGKRKTEDPKVNKCASAGHRYLPNWATQPRRRMAWGAGRVLAVPAAPVCLPRGEQIGRPCRPSLPPAARGRQEPPPFEADRAPVRQLPPPGSQRLPMLSPRAVATRPFGPRRPPWAARDRSRGQLHHPASHEIVRGLPGRRCRRRPRQNALTPVRASLRGALIACHLWRSWRRICRSAPTRRHGSNLVTGVCSIAP